MYITCIKVHVCIKLRFLKITKFYDSFLNFLHRLLKNAIHRHKMFLRIQRFWLHLSQVWLCFPDTNINGANHPRHLPSHHPLFTLGVSLLVQIQRQTILRHLLHLRLHYLSYRRHFVRNGRHSFLCLNEFLDGLFAVRSFLTSMLWINLRSFARVYFDFSVSSNLQINCFSIFFLST